MRTSPKSYLSRETLLCALSQLTFKRITSLREWPANKLFFPPKEKSEVRLYILKICRTVRALEGYMLWRDWQSHKESNARAWGRKIGKRNAKLVARAARSYRRTMRDIKSQ